MGYRKEIYDKAFKFVSDYKKEKEALYDRAILALRTADPEFNDIDITLSKLGGELVLQIVGRHQSDQEVNNDGYAQQNDDRETESF